MFVEVNLVILECYGEIKTAKCACGNDPIYGYDVRRNRFQVFCKNSGCRKSYGMTIEGAVDSWNEIQKAARQEIEIAALKERAK